MTGANLPASIQARLLQRAKTEGRDYTQVLTRYGLERLLYRLSISAYAENFLLKGALLFDLWFDVPLRPTRDIEMPRGIPQGLSDKFSADPDKQRQWTAFLSKNRLVPPMQDLAGHQARAWIAVERWQ